MRSGWALWTSRSSGYSELSSGGRLLASVFASSSVLFRGGGGGVHAGLFELDRSDSPGGAGRGAGSDPRIGAAFKGVGLGKVVLAALMPSCLCRRYRQGQ